MLPTAQALATGAFRRSQVYVKYSNGLELWVNGHTSESWEVSEVGMTLPPNGWYARGKFSEGDLIAYSALVEGHRADYVDSPTYLYANGRGTLTRFPKAACDGQIVLLPQADGSYELIPVGSKVMAVSLDGRSARAVGLDEENRKELGAAEVRWSRGLVHVVPQDGAFSYRLVPEPAPQEALGCERESVVAGETVTIQGKDSQTWVIPPDSKPGDHIWYEGNGKWLDFRVIPLAGLELALKDKAWSLRVRSNLPAEQDFSLTLNQQTQQVRLQPGVWQEVVFPFVPLEKEQVVDLPVEVKSGSFRLVKTWGLRCERKLVEVVGFPAIQRTMQAFRQQDERSVDNATGAIVDRRTTRCGNVEKACIFMHPPYQGGVGYVAALLEPVQLPAEPAASLRCAVGKGDGSDPGDGILYQVFVIDAKGQATLLGEKTQREHAWADWELDLSPWRGQQITLKLVADVGPAGNSIGDWGCWADLKIESREPQWVHTIIAPKE